MPHPKSTTKKKEVRALKAWGLFYDDNSFYSASLSKLALVNIKERVAKQLFGEDLKLVPVLITLLPNKKGKIIMKKSFEQNSINKGCCKICVDFGPAGEFNELVNEFCANPSCKCHSDKPVECDCGYEKGNGHSIICPAYEEKTLEEALKGCKHAKLRYNTKFCPDCGERMFSLEEISIPPTKAPSWSDNKIKEMFSDWIGIDDNRQYQEFTVLQIRKLISDTLTSERTRLLEGLGKMRKRFKCASCDGSKCEHTQSCQALSEAETLIKGELK